MKIILKPAARVESKDPPIVFRPKLACELAGFTTISYLVQHESDPKIQFPFQRELALYLLLIASLWPRNADRLLVAARIFSGGLNFQMSGSRKHLTPKRPLDGAYSASKLDVFNRAFFSRIGGPDSLLFCPSTEEFHRDIWAHINKLAMMHDVIEFLLKTAHFPELCSARMAFAAIAGNLFERKGGYGVPSGSKRKHQAGYVATSETVRARWKAAPDTIVLSFVLTRWYGVHYFDPASPMFFLHLNKCVESGSRKKLVNFLTIAQERLRVGRAEQNSSILKWLQPDTASFPKPLYFKPLTVSEFDQLIEIRKNNRQFKRGLTAKQEGDLRSRLSDMVASNTTFPSVG